MNRFLLFLLVPAIFAIIVFIGNMTIYTNETSPLSGYYSLMMTFWGVVFTVFWRRHCHSLNVLWDGYVTEHEYENLRKEFKGRLAINPVTDKPDTVFTFRERIPFYFVSAAVCIPCLALCIFVIICFLNMTGVIRPEDHGGFFDIPTLSSMANEGAIFDPESNMNMVIGGVQALVTFVMNLAFRKVAVWTTNLENHKTTKAYNNSVFVKRLVFEFTDFQLYLFYIGIY